MVTNSRERGIYVAADTEEVQTPADDDDGQTQFHGGCLLRGLVFQGGIVRTGGELHWESLP